MAMSVLRALADKNKLSSVDMVVGKRYVEIAEFLRATDLPIGEIVAEPYECQVMDSFIAGACMASWSERFLRQRYRGYTHYWNACLPCPPPSSIHMVNFMRYLVGLDTELSTVMPRIESIVVDCEKRREVVFHFGSNDRRRQIQMIERPLPESVTTVCVGTENEPCPGWIDVDLRGEGFGNCLYRACGATIVVGSDSVYTHVSGIAGVPTLCLAGENEWIASRRCYQRGESSTDIDAIVCILQDFWAGVSKEVAVS